MFKRPGQKLKILAGIIFFFYVILGCIVGYILSYTYTSAIDANAVSEILVGNAHPGSMFLVMLGGVIGMLVGWINSIMLYVFGQLVDDVEMIKNRRY